MNNFEFYNPVKLVFGNGESSKIGEYAKGIGSCALIVSYKNVEFYGDLFEKIKLYPILLILGACNDAENTLNKEENESAAEKINPAEKCKKTVCKLKSPAKNAERDVCYTEVKSHINEALHSRAEEHFKIAISDFVDDFLECG